MLNKSSLNHHLVCSFRAGALEGETKVRSQTFAFDNAKLAVCAHLMNKDGRNGVYSAHVSLHVGVVEEMWFT